MNKTEKARVFSAMQPTGKLHIGNYIGALSVWAKEQDRFDGIFCVVNLHALTVPDSIDPAVLHEKTLETAAIYLASGIDPKKSSVYIQSTVSEHAELAWVLTCLTPLGWLERMTQYKAKSALKEAVGAGLLSYPILMAADILLYDAQLVPVGHDQKQHVEFTRDLASRFNNRFGLVFTLPEPMIRKVGARIMGLDDPDQKMSKSIGEIKTGHSIGIMDHPDVIKKAVKSAVTDSGRQVDFDNAGRGVRNLLAIYQAVTNCTDDRLRSHFADKGYGFLKSEIIEVVCEVLHPVREEALRLLQERRYLEKVVAEGAEKVRVSAREKMKAVKEAVGISF